MKSMKHELTRRASKRAGTMKILVGALGLWACAFSPRVQAATASPTTLVWKGIPWNIKSGAGKNPGRNSWSASNAFVDASGDLHLTITNVGGTWYCAEIWTTGTFGMGTLQWQVKTAVDNLDPNVVFGLFLYGPPAAGPDGTHEIDIEYSRFGSPPANNGRWTVWPNEITSPPQLGRMTFPLALGGDPTTTSRLTWNPDTVAFSTLGGFATIGSNANAINSWSFGPADPSASIPPFAMPIHLNLWLYQASPPTNGQNVEVVIHDFSFTPAPSVVPALPIDRVFILAACLLGVGLFLLGRARARLERASARRAATCSRSEARKVELKAATLGVAEALDRRVLPCAEGLREGAARASTSTEGPRREVPDESVRASP